MGDTGRSSQTNLRSSQANLRSAQADARNDTGGGGRYLSLGRSDRESMLATIGVAHVDELFADIPAAARFAGMLALEPAMSELELVEHLEELAAANASAGRVSSFLGAGCNPHFVPTHVDALIQRQEFLTAYTPYQAEVGQGTLQAIFEFQSLVCMLTGMDVCNASVYDGASAVAEAVLMARRLARRGGRVLVSEGVHPAYRSVARTYAKYLDDIEFEVLPLDEHGRTVIGQVDDDVFAVVMQQPNFFGVVEDLRQAGRQAATGGAKFVVSTTEPVAFGLAIPPAHAGADLVVGELQSFGNGMNFGGPLVGFMACLDADKRNLPGRLAGRTVDADGKDGYVLTLSTREQHIRRARATSNICTNEALCALAACIHMCSLGRNGIAELARTNLAKTTYARGLLASRGVRAVYDGPHFNELVVRVGGDAAEVVDRCLTRDVIPGVALGRFDAARADQLLMCVTEVHSKQAIDHLADVLAEAVA